MRPAHSSLRQADQIEQVARLFQVHRHAMAHVVDLAQGADQQRRRNGDRLASLRGGRNSLLRLSLPLMNGVPRRWPRRGRPTRHGPASRASPAGRCRPSRSCRGWRCAADRPRRPRSCAPPRRSRWRPSSRDRNRRSGDSCRRRRRCRGGCRSTGRSTAASPGPSLAAPTSGFRTLPPCTSWSYWRITHSLLHTFSEPRIFREHVGVVAAGPLAGGPAPTGGGGDVDRVADHRRAAVVQEFHRQVGHLLVVVFQHAAGRWARTGR